MKKMIFLFAACLMTAAVSAQTITEKMIAGKWEMSGFNIEGINWDFKTDKFSLPAEVTEAMQGPDLEATIAAIKEGMSPLKDGHIYIKPGKKYEQVLMGEEATGEYAIAFEDGQHYLDITNDGSDIVDRLKLDMPEGRLQISMPDDEGGEIILLFDKTK